MPFILRDENTTDNPPLATVYGKQITAGKVVYYLGNKSIIILGDGEMDGIDQLLYNGEVLDTTQYVFHPGAITTQIVPIDVTAISGDTITLASNPFNTTTEKEVALVAGVDPTPSPYPTGVKQHQKLYVANSSGNNIKLSLTDGGTPLTWTSSTYLTTNLKVYRANKGYFDPVQGRPTYFPDIDYTFSGIAYVEVTLTGDMAEVEDEPTKFQIFVRGRKLQNYDATGLLADADGVAYPDQNNLPAQHKFFSANNALVAIDIILNYMKVAPSRINWASFVKFRTHCDEVISWNSGSNAVASVPNYTLQNVTQVSIGTMFKNNGSALPWNAAALSVESHTLTEESPKLEVSGIYRGGVFNGGITNATSIPVPLDNNSYIAGIAFSTGGQIYVLAGNNSSPVYTVPSTRKVNYGDKFKVTYQRTGTTTASYTVVLNDEYIYSGNLTLNTDPLRAYYVFGDPNSRVSEAKMFPVLSVSRPINRFDAHVVFPSEIPSATALEQVMGRAPSCHWQDVNGKIQFIVGSQYVDLTLGETPTVGDRVLVKYLSYDPTQVAVKSNIVENSFAYYRKPAEEKQNFLRVEFRDVENEVFLKKYSFQDRPVLRDYVNSLVDFGIVQIGVASQSLADRMGESILRWNSDLDLFVTVRGTHDTFDLAKGDIVKFAHEVPGWTLDDAPTFMVISETFEPDTVDERSFTLQVYSEDYYSDTAHGAISPYIPSLTSRLVPPPPPESLQLSEETRTLPDGSEYTTIAGVVFFDLSYPYTQRARVYWKRETDVEFTPTSIVLEQPTAAVNALSFNLNFATLGLNQVKVVTESMTGLVSEDFIVENINISGTVQIDLVSWEGFVNTETILGRLTKIAGAAAWDAGARSTKALSRGSGYVQWNFDVAGKIAIGLSVYNNTTIALNNTQMLYGLIIENGQQPIPVYNGSTVAAVGSISQVGYGYKIEVNEVTNKVHFYEVIDGVATEIYNNTRFNIYPLYVDSSIYNAGNSIAQPQFYGRLEQTTGYKVHWTNIAGITITDETLTKVVGSDWATPNQGIAWSIEYMSGDGAVECEATALGTYRGVGLSPVDIDFTDPTLLGFMSVKYMWYMKGSLFSEPPGSLSVIEGDGLTYNEYGGFTYAPGDILRVERVGTEIRYRQNGILRYTSTIPSPIGELLHPDVAMYNNASTVKNIRLKKVGNLNNTVYPYPIYLATDLRVVESRPELDGTVYAQLAGLFPTDAGAPILRANVKVYDKFGNIVKVFPPFTYAGNGIIGQGHHPRKYADPMSEAIYQIQIANDDTTSLPIYIKGDGTNFTSSLVMPTLKNFNNAVKDLSCSPVDHNKITLTWVYTGNAQVEYRIGTTGAWSTPITALTSPYTVTGLVPDTFYEFRVAPTGTSDNYSNISRCKTQPAPLTPEAAPPPLTLTGTLDATNPDTKVNLSWNRNSTTNTGVKIYQDGALIYTGSTPTEVAKQITGLTAGTTYNFKVKNVYSGGDSEFSNEITVTTDLGTGANIPSELYADGVGANRVDLVWTNHVSTGNIEIYRSNNGTTWSGTPIATVPATLDTYNNTGLLANRGYFYRVKNSGIAGFSNVAYAETYQQNQCVWWKTLIYTVVDGNITLKAAWQIEEGDIVVSIKKGGLVSNTVVKKVFKGKSDTLNILTTSEGKTLYCTPSHPIITNKDLDVVTSKNVKIEDSILTYNKEVDKVQIEMLESKESIKGDFDIVIFEMENEEHTFVSEGFVSHNIDNKNPI